MRVAISCVQAYTGHSCSSVLPSCRDVTPAAKARTFFMRSNSSREEFGVNGLERGKSLKGVNSLGRGAKGVNGAALASSLSGPYYSRAFQIEEMTNECKADQVVTTWMDTVWFGTIWGNTVRHA